MAAFSASGENFNPTTNPNREEQEEDYEKTYQNYNKMLQTLPKGKGWRNPHLVKYQNCWLNPNTGLKGVLLIQNHFKPKPTDTFLASFMKSGTTWLRSLLFATVNRTRYDFSSHPLLTTNPHSSSVFPFLDAYIYDKHPIADLDSLPSPRLFATHMPYALLPEPVTCTGSKFVYVWRDPKDVLVSKWLYMRRHRPKDLPPLTLHEAFELFCDGVSDYGPFWDHVLGYWNASLKLPGNILVLKYEEMKREPAVYVKRLAEFMEVPFSVEEEKGGVVEEIVELCSFDKLSNLEVNKTGVLRLNEHIVVPNRDFFRKGEIGDGKNYLTDEMIERLDCITKSKFDGYSLGYGFMKENYSGNMQNKKGILVGLHGIIEDDVRGGLSELLCHFGYHAGRVLMIDSIHFVDLVEYSKHFHWTRIKYLIETHFSWKNRVQLGWNPVCQTHLFKRNTFQSGIDRYPIKMLICMAIVLDEIYKNEQKRYERKQSSKHFRHGR